METQEAEGKRKATPSSLLLCREQCILSHYILFVSLPFCSQYEETRLIQFPAKTRQLFCWLVWRYVGAVLLQPRRVKDGLAEKSRRCTLQRKVGDSEAGSVVPLLAHICTGKRSGNSHIRAELPKKEVIFPLSNKAQSDWAVEANFTSCYLAVVLCSTCCTGAMIEILFFFFFKTFFLLRIHLYSVFDPSLSPNHLSLQCHVLFFNYFLWIFI